MNHLTQEELNLIKELRSGVTPELTDEERERTLDERGIIPGVAVRDPKGKIALVTDRGRMTKDHSTRPDKRKDYYVKLRRRKPDGKFHHTLVRYDHALTLEVVQEVM